MRQTERARKMDCIVRAQSLLPPRTPQHDLSLFGPRIPIYPDEKEFGSFGQKLLKDNLSQKISSALQHSSQLCSSQESQICDIPRQAVANNFLFFGGGGTKGVLLRDELHCC